MKNKQTNMNNSEKWEDLAYDIMNFCNKWGLWCGVAMYTREKHFVLEGYSGISKHKCFRDLTSVWVSYIWTEEELAQKDINPLVPKTLVIYDLAKGESPLAHLLGHGEYCVELEEVSSEGFEFILNYEGFDCDGLPLDSCENANMRLELKSETCESDSCSVIERALCKQDYEILYDKWDKKVSYEKGTEVYTKVIEEFNAVLEKHNVGYDPYDGELDDSFDGCLDAGLRFYEK